MKRLGLVLSVGMVAGMVGYWSPGFGQELTIGPPAGTLHDGAAFRFERITDDIYHVRGAGTMSVGSNSVVIINDEDVLLVDSSASNHQSIIAASNAKLHTSLLKFFEPSTTQCEKLLTRSAAAAAKGQRCQRVQGPNTPQPLRYLSNGFPQSRPRSPPPISAQFTFLGTSYPQFTRPRGA